MTEFRVVHDAVGADPATLMVAWARLGVLWWRDVAVVVAEPVELTGLDRFVVDTARRLGRLTADDFHEITGLSGTVFAALARRLHAFDLIDWRGDVVTARDAGVDADGPHSATRTTTDSLDFLYLPDSDDLVAVAGSLGEFERAWPRRSRVAPLPEALAETSRNELLRRRIDAGDVVGLPPAVVGLAEERDEPLTTMSGARPDPPVPVCPAFECAASITRDGDAMTVSLDIGVRKARKGGDRGDAVAVTVKLGAASGLIASWQRLTSEIGRGANRTAVVRALVGDTGDPRLLRSTDEHGWSLGITGPQAEEVAARRSLAEPRVVEVRGDHAHVRVAVRLTPVDDAAKRLFAADEFIGRLLVRPKEVSSTMVEQGVLVDRAGGTGEIMRRAWALGHFWIVHHLREREDFNYA